MRPKILLSGVPLGTIKLVQMGTANPHEGRHAYPAIVFGQPRDPGHLRECRQGHHHAGEAPQKGAWLIVLLLFLFMVINFADKAVIGIAAVPLMKELHLSPREFGLVGSSFFLLFALSAVVTGFIVNRVQTRWALLVMGFVWALTQFPMLGTVGFGTMVACPDRARRRRGTGLSGRTAFGLQMVSRTNCAPCRPRSSRRAPASASWWRCRCSTGSSCIILGIGRSACSASPASLWTAAWLALGREGSLTAAAAVAKNTAAPEKITYGQLLLSPTILACWCASFGAQWGLSQALSWQGAFLIKGLGLPQSSIGLLGALPAGASVVLVIAAGWYSQRLLARGVSSRVARGILGGGSVALGGAALALMPFLPGIAVKITLTTIGIAVPSVIHVISHTVVSDLTPVAQRGAMLAIGTAVGTSAGLLSPYVTGRVVETAATLLDGFNTGFMICGVIMLTGGLIGMALIRPEHDAMRWPSVTPTPAIGSA